MEIVAFCQLRIEFSQVCFHLLVGLVRFEEDKLGTKVKSRIAFHADAFPKGKKM